MKYGETVEPIASENIEDRFLYCVAMLGVYGFITEHEETLIYQRMDEWRAKCESQGTPKKVSTKSPAKKVVPNVPQKAPQKQNQVPGMSEAG